MERKPIGVAAVVVAVVLGALGPSVLPTPKPAEGKTGFRVLVFSRTEGFRHDSIPAGVNAYRRLGRSAGFSVTATERPGVFRDRSLGRFDVVVFLLTTGDVLPPRGERALKRFIRKGGGFVGVHSAADTEYGWPFYRALLGARFSSHPATQQARVEVLDRSHPSTTDLPASWTRTDEWYNFDASPRGAVHVLARLDESSYSGGTMGADHPIAWCHKFRGGRSWYTGGGHPSEAYSEPAFRRHLRGGVLWAAGESPGRCPLA